MRFPAWTPDVIDSMDPDFIEELTARLEAEHKHEQKIRKRSRK